MHDPPGIPWQAARTRAAAMLDAWADRMRAAGIDPATLAGRSGPAAVYPDSESYGLAGEPPDLSPRDHAIVIRAAIQEARKRWNFRFVPITLPAVEYLAWLAGRENTPAARAAFLADQFARLAL